MWLCETPAFSQKSLAIAAYFLNPTSLGPDGIPSIFYQKFWNIVGPNTTECVLNILKSEIMPTCKVVIYN